MRTGVIAKKVGMTRLFQEDGRHVPVTVLSLEDCQVVSVRTADRDGYVAVQLGAGSAKQKNVAKPQREHFAKANVAAGRGVWEFRLEGEEFQVGDQINAEIFQAGQLVDVTGQSKGKGFAGTIKRWNHQRGPESHGSKNHRQTASLGARMSGGGGKVFKGKKMPGQLGGDRVTVQNLEVVRVDTDRSILLVKGGIPGAKGSLVMVKTAVKSSK